MFQRQLGLRESVRVLQQEMGQFFDPTKIVVTTCDADSKFHPKYIETLTSRFLKEENPDTAIFQAPLLYNWGLDGTSFVTRVTGLLRSTLMMGALIPFNINTMSIFSFSLKLCMNGNYVHPAYQMDDIICLIRWMGVTGQRLRILLIPVPVISGPIVRVGPTSQALDHWGRGGVPLLCDQGQQNPLPSLIFMGSMLPYLLRNSLVLSRLVLRICYCFNGGID